MFAADGDSFTQSNLKLTEIINADTADKEAKKIRLLKELLKDTEVRDTYISEVKCQLKQ